MNTQNRQPGLFAEFPPGADQFALPVLFLSPGELPLLEKDVPKQKHPHAVWGVAIGQQTGAGAAQGFVAHSDGLGQVQAAGVDGLTTDRAFDVEMFVALEFPDVVDVGDTATGNHQQVGHIAQIGRTGHIDAGQHPIPADVGVDHPTHPQGSHAMAQFNYVQFAGLLPAVGRHFAVPGVDAHDDPLCAPAFDGLPYQVRVFDRGCAQHHPIRAQAQGQTDVLQAAHTPAKLDGYGNRLANALQTAQIDGQLGHGQFCVRRLQTGHERRKSTPVIQSRGRVVECAVQIDHMQPLCALALPMAGHLRRVFTKNRLCIGVALTQTHTAPLTQVNCGVDNH